MSQAMRDYLVRAASAPFSEELRAAVLVLAGVALGVLVCFGGRML
jgi:hypothetical protein